VPQQIGQLPVLPGFSRDAIAIFNAIDRRNVCEIFPYRQAQKAQRTVTERTRTKRSTTKKGKHIRMRAGTSQALQSSPPGRL